MDIMISTDFIKLQQLLKLAQISGQGSDVKYFIQNSTITVNGVRVTERGKKIYKMDVVEVEGYEQILVC